jgi:ubiquinone/menaquinone biosynthesis C-methylase UbiE
LRQAVGSEGRIVGVDLTGEMLAEAAKRIAENHWSNVELVQSDAAMFQFPQPVDGVLSTFAITLMPEYDRIIKNGAMALRPGKKIVILDFKKPDTWPAWLINLFVFVTRPFGVSIDLAERHPWDSIHRYLTHVQLHEFYFGGVYICVGEAPS